MAESFYPFDNNAVTTELQWSRMMRILMPDGVDTLPSGGSLLVTKVADLTVSVAVGNAWCRGFYYSLSDTPIQVALPLNSATTARIDLIVLRVDWTANTMTPTFIQGTAAASPTAPAPVKSEASGIFDLPLAEVRVEPTDVISTVTDRRRFVGRPVVWCTSGNRPDPEGRPLLAFETDTNRVIFNSGSGAWNVGMGNDVYRPLYVYSGDNGTTSSTNWDATLTDSATASLSLSFVAPPSGRAIVRIGAFLSNIGGGGTTYMAVRLIAADGSVVWGIRNNTSTTNFGADRMVFMNASNTTDSSGSTCSSVFYAPSLTPGVRYTAGLFYGVSSGTATIDDRYIEIDPLP